MQDLPGGEKDGRMLGRGKITTMLQIDQEKKESIAVGRHGMRRWGNRARSEKTKKTGVRILNAVGSGGVKQSRKSRESQAGSNGGETSHLDDLTTQKSGKRGDKKDL